MKKGVVLAAALFALVWITPAWGQWWVQQATVKVPVCIRCGYDHASRRNVCCLNPV
jgi:hypothetical protein